MFGCYAWLGRLGEDDNRLSRKLASREADEVYVLMVSYYRYH